MKTKGMSTVAAVLIAAFAASTANAVPIEFEETFTLSTPEVLSGRHDFYSYQHFLTPQLGADRVLEVTVDGAPAPGEGYDSATDSLLDGYLTLWFSGTDQWMNGSFEVLVDLTSIGSGNFTSQFTVGQGNDLLISAISSAGVLDVTIQRTNAAHSAQLDKSMLTVFGERGQSTSVLESALTVPEPGTLSLLAVGLAGVALRSRKTRPGRRA